MGNDSAAARDMGNNNLEGSGISYNLPPNLQSLNDEDRLKKLNSEHGNVQLGNITVDMVLGGMRRMIIMLWETSLLEPEVFRNTNVGAEGKKGTRDTLLEYFKYHLECRAFQL
ncbi:unnamed protein product [Miscanthus lutarioriparius]|uniref:Uncharacterized protein n=1 Tax=Miscanthus lutarioriparius TaxID=422564 RepID=A0A811SGI6_9POAL|nr:unnamed protein product [Miscanthus lutarioriparius]